MTYENKNEEKLLEQFAMSVLKIFNMCMRINSPPLINSARNDLKPSCSFNLDKTENDMKMNNTYASEDFLFSIQISKHCCIGKLFFLSFKVGRTDCDLFSFINSTTCVSSNLPFSSFEQKDSGV